VPAQHAWERCLAATPHAGPDVWIHTDLMPGNLIMRGGRLTALIDLGEGQVGDPAVDLMPAWNLLSGPARATYRRVLDVDDAAWERPRLVNRAGRPRGRVLRQDQPEHVPSRDPDAGSSRR